MPKHRQYRDKVLTQHPRRVRTLDTAVINAAKADYRPDALKGKPVNYQSEKASIRVAREQLYLVMPHEIVSPMLLKLQSSLNDALAVLQAAYEAANSDHYQPNFIESRRQILRDLEEEIRQIYKNYTQFLDGALPYINHVKTPEDLRVFGANFISKAELTEKESRINATITDLPRAITIEGRPVNAPKAGEDPSKYFRDLLRRIGADEDYDDLIDFFLEYLNQKAILAGEANNFAADILPVKIAAFEAAAVAPGDSDTTESISHSTDIRIERDKDGHPVKPPAFIVTFKNNLEVSVGLPSAVETRYGAKNRIVRAGNRNKKAHDNIVVEQLDDYGDTFHPQVQNAFLAIHISSILEKLRGRQELFVNDWLLIDSYLSPYLTVDKKPDLEKLKNANADTLFLLMWSQPAHAEILLTDKNYSLDSFFRRNYKKIELDLNILQEKHYYFLAERKRIDLEIGLYLDAVALCGKHLSIPEKHQRAERDLARENKKLTELNKNPARDLRAITSTTQTISRLQREIVNLQGLIKLGFVKEIENKLSSTKPEEQSYKGYLLTSMLTINDVSFVRELLKRPAIRNNLDVKVLTHFAKLNPQIADSLVSPSWWERVKFKVRSWFVRGEVLPKERFSSPELKEIVATHPHLWDTAFAQGSELRAKLDIPQWLELVSTKQGHTDSYKKSYDNFMKEPKVLAALERQGELMPWNDRLHYNLENPKASFDFLIMEKGVEKEEQKEKEKAKAKAKERVLDVEARADERTPLIPWNDSLKYSLENPRSSLDFYTEQNNKQDPKVQRAKEIMWDNIHTLSTDKELYNFYKTKFEQALTYQDKPHNYILCAFEDLWGDFPVEYEEVNGERKEVKKAMRHDWSYDPFLKKGVARTREGTIIKEIAKAALIEATSSANIVVARTNFEKNGWLPKRISFADVFLNAPFKPPAPNNSPAPRVEGPFRPNVFSKKQMAVLQETLLSNYTTFREFTDEVILDVEDINGLAENLRDKNKFAIFKNEHFRNLIKNSRHLYQAFKIVFDQEAVKEVIEGDSELRKIKRELFQQEPTMTNSGEVHTCVLESFKDANFVKQIEQFKYRGGAQSFSAVLEKLHKRARYFQTMLGQEHLFNYTWQKFKQKPVHYLLELSLLKPKEQFSAWLKKYPEEINYIINLMIKDPSFREQFVSCHFSPGNTTMQRLLLIETATDEQLTTLILQSPEIATYLLERLQEFSNNTRVHRLNKRDNYFVRRLESIVKHTDAQKLGLIFAQYPNLLAFLQVFDLYEENLDKIKGAIYSVRLIIDKKIDANDANEKLTNKTTASKEIFADLEKSVASQWARCETKPENHGSAIIQGINLILTNKEINVDLLHAYLSDPKVILRIVESVKLQEGNNNMNFIDMELLSKVNHPNIKYDVKQFCNALLAKAIVDPVFCRKLFTHCTYLIPYLDQNCAPEYVGRFLVMYAGTPATESIKWLNSLTRFAAKEEIFTDSFAVLSKCPKFGRWLFQQAHEAKDLLFYSIQGEGKKFPLITEETIKPYLENQDYAIEDLLAVMLRQFDGIGRFEPSIREVLRMSSIARDKFKYKASGHVSKVMELLLLDLQTEDKVLAKDWLKPPFLGHLLQGATNSNIRDLIFSLTRLKNSFEMTFEKENEPHKAAALDIIMDELIQLTIFDSEVREKHMQSNAVPQELLEYALKSPETARRLLLSFINHQPVNLGFVSVLKSNAVNYLMPFFGREKGQANGLIQIFLFLLQEKLPDKDREELLNLVGTSNNLVAMLNDEVDPTLKLELLIALLEQQRDPRTLRNEAKILRQNLNQMTVYTDEARKIEFLHSLAPDELAHLYIKDGVDFTEINPIAGFAYLFREEIEGSSLFKDEQEESPPSREIINRIFLQADVENLLELFDVSPHLVNLYLTQAKKEPPAPRLIGDKFGETLALDLRARILTDKLEKGRNLLHSLICHSSPQEVSELFEVLCVDRRLFERYIDELKHSKLRSFKEPATQLTNHVICIVKHGTSAHLKEIIEAFEPADENKNEVTLRLVQQITGNGTAKNKFIEALQNDPGLKEVFLQSIRKNLSTKAVFELLIDESFETLFLDYFKKFPQQFEQIFLRDLQSVEGDINAKRCDDEFFDYFFHSKKRLDIYTFINEHLPQSRLVKVIDEGLNVKWAALMFASENNIAATAKQLATIYNFESVKRKFPITDQIILSPDQSPKFRLMLAALPAVNRAFIHTEKFRTALTKLDPDERGAKVPLNARAFMDAFRRDKTNGLEFATRLQPNSKLSLAHELVYMYAHNVNFSHELPKYKNRDAERFVFVKRYYHEIQEYVDIDNEGRLIFKGTKEEVPADHAIFYYDAVAMFLTHPHEPVVRNLIRQKPRFIENLLSTIQFDDSGVARFAEGFVNKPVPPYYTNTVLTALVMRDVPINFSVSLANAFLRSANCQDEKFYYAGTVAASNNFIANNPKYFAAFKESINYLLQENPAYLTSIASLAILSGLAEFEDILERYPVIKNAFKNSICIDVDGKIYFKGTKKEPSKKYIAKVISILPKPDNAETADQFLLRRFADGGQPNLPKGDYIFGMLKVTADNQVVFKRNDFPVSISWLNYALSNMSLDQLRAQGTVSKDQFLSLIELEDSFEIRKEGEVFVPHGEFKFKNSEIKLTDQLKEFAFEILREKAKNLTFDEKILCLLFNVPDIEVLLRGNGELVDAIRNRLRYVAKLATLLYQNPEFPAAVKQLPDYFIKAVNKLNLSGGIPLATHNNEIIGGYGIQLTAQQMALPVVLRDSGSDLEIDNRGVDGRYGLPITSLGGVAGISMFAPVAAPQPAPAAQSARSDMEPIEGERFTANLLAAKREVKVN